MPRQYDDATIDAMTIIMRARRALILETVEDGGTFVEWGAERMLYDAWERLYATGKELFSEQSNRPV